MIEHLIKAATFRIACGSDSGTGWLIGPDLVLTARHCVIEGINNGQAVELYCPSSGDGPAAGQIVDQSEDLDVCLISLEPTSAVDPPLPVSLERPREGESWQTFGYPQGKATLGHRLSGTIAQVLETPTLKIDLDLSINTDVLLQTYKGMSGAAVICEGVVIGMIRFKVDGTVAALSMNQMENFLTKNGVDLPGKSTTPLELALADRGDFPEEFAKEVQGRPGSYLFLEGAHGYGKSTFCINFQPDDTIIVNLGAYCLSDPESVLGANYRAQPPVFLDWLMTKISGLITGQPPRKEIKDYPEQIQETAKYLNAFSEYCEQRSRQGMLFIDGLNEIPRGTILDALLGLLPAKLPPRVSVVLTAPNYATMAVPLSGKVKTTDVFKLPPLDYSACYNYCKEALKPERSSPALVDRICEKANGHPLYLRYLIEYVNLQPTDDELGDFPVLNGPIEEYYQGIWAKLLPDSDSVNMLALMARLRWGVSSAEFAKTLNPLEQAQFVSVMSRIRHLLAGDGSTAIYHASFAAFIIGKTAEIDETALRRLAKFCREEPGLRYCSLNLIFHLLRAKDETVFEECNQAWFDTSVTLGVEPDALIADVDSVVKRAAMEGSPDEFFRLTLLAQRINFRYNTLFAQSARLIAEALIVLGRPSEALQHVFRFKTLIVGLEDALEIGFLLHQHGYDDESLILLEYVQQRIIDSYQPPIELANLLTLCSLHIQTIFQIRLAINANVMEEFSRIINLAEKACENIFGEDSEKKTIYMEPLIAESPAHFLSFCDEYAELSRLKDKFGDKHDFSKFLPSLCLALLKFESSVENFHLSKNRRAFRKLFADLEALIANNEIDPQLAYAVTDTLIRFGAAATVVELFGAKGLKPPARSIEIKAENGVDVNHKNLQECLCDWRVTAFLDAKFQGPSAGIIAGTDWLASLEHLIGALYCCDGRARRALADSNEPARIAFRDQLKVKVIDPLRFTLEQRASWIDCYAIPENLLPGVYRQLTELLIDCFPELLPQWLENLVADAGGQWGMYTEGFRESVVQVLGELTREKPDDELAPKLLGLLHAWRDHVLRGVENRHELVPEILRMIPIFVNLGAKEDAERLYQRLLSVSMGPTWYKEDQLGFLIDVLEGIDVRNNVSQRFPEVAGYLEKGSGEMTFQRFVCHRKSSLIGEIARRNKFRAAFDYFRRQSCGSLEEMWAEAQQGPIDKVGSLKGNRFPGGALDEQSAVLALVRNSESVSWEMRWALLEIFHCGDSRHLTEYAETFANIVNQVGTLPELIRRAEIVTIAETPIDDRANFMSAFGRALNPEYHEAFASILAGFAPTKPSDLPAPDSNCEAEDDNTEDMLYHPGVFGRRKSLREAEKICDEAEAQLSLGNQQKAKSLAVKVLQTAQEGGWGIWENHSSISPRAEEILVQEEVSAANIIRYYAPLIEAECYVQKWIPAQHLIGKIGQLLSETEGQRLIDAVIEHCRLVVGDAPREIKSFKFLANESPEPNAEIEFFRFTVWLCDHPMWLRRDRAAAMLLWIIEQVPEVFSEAATTAFSMMEGYGPDVLCGVFDGISAREPEALWDKIEKVLDFERLVQELRHISRMVVLERLATRGDNAGSSTAKSAMAKIKASFCGKTRHDERATMPEWADVLGPEWTKLRKFINSDIIVNWENELTQLCFPLSIKDARELETAVLESFRENHRPLDRWESKVRCSLNIALWPFLSKEDSKNVEATLRIYNPTHPERSVIGHKNSFTETLTDAINTGDYSLAFCSNPITILHYHEMILKPKEHSIYNVEVLCILQPATSNRVTLGPQLVQRFCSSELPKCSTVSTPFETCSWIDPRFVFFGVFTPAVPLPFFQNLVNAKLIDFDRQNWRYGRENDHQHFGIPNRCGCSLSIPRQAFKLPIGFKLAWIVYRDSMVVTVVDEHNNIMM